MKPDLSILSCRHLLRSILIIVVCTSFPTDRVLGDGWGLFSADLRDAQSRIELSNKQFEQLGPLRLRQTVQQAGAQLQMTTDPPPQAPWIQLDLGSVQAFDQIMIVPAIAGTANITNESYAFPKRFRVDLSSSKDFHPFQLLYDSVDHELDSTSPHPVVIATPTARARYLRITMTELVKVTGRWTCALSEIMVIRGDRNIALGAEVTMPDSTILAPVWDRSFLTDGRTPLGPPIMPARSDEELPPFDGVYCQADESDAEMWFQIDLGSVQTVDAIRLFPVHARQGADYPGYGFPVRFRIDGSSEDSFDQPTVKTLYQTQEDFENPGNNPVTLKVNEASVRYVRFICERDSVLNRNKFGLAEVQLLDDSKNRAANKTVTALHLMEGRPLELLVDGDASFGKIMTLRDWSDRWKSARAAQRDIRLAQRRIEPLTKIARRRVYGTAGCFGLLAGFGLMGLASKRRRRRAKQRSRQRAEFRIRLAQDLHDEIGSNLAAIARIGEVGEAVGESDELKEDWRSVRELAGECSESMQETLWLLGGPKRGDECLADQFRSIAARMLPGIEMRWNLAPGFDQFSPGDTAEREIVLVFKAVLANIARSSNATEVNITTNKRQQRWLIRVGDNGSGFNAAAWESRLESRGMGLENMASRIKKLGGTLKIESEPGAGTRLEIEIPE